MLDFTDADEAISDSPILSLTPRASLASTASSTDVGAIDDLPISQRVRVCVRVKPGDEKMVAAEPGGRAVTLSDEAAAEGLGAPTPGFAGARTPGRNSTSDDAPRTPGGRVARLAATPGRTPKSRRSAAPVKRYAYDAVCAPDCGQTDVFAECVGPIDAALGGANGTIFAYGQTGSGKTYTMIGEANAPGVVPRAVDRVFTRVDATPDTTWRVYVTYAAPRAIRRAIPFKSLTRAPPAAGTSSCTTTRGATSSPTTTRRARAVCRSRR